MSERVEEFALTPTAGHELTKRPKPTLVAHDTKGLVPSDARWHPSLAAEYVLRRGGQERWIPIKELARVFFVSDTPSNRARVRSRLFRVCNIMLDSNILLVIETGQRAAAQACKVYNPRSTEERQYLRARLERMRAQRLIRTAQLEKAFALAECLDEQRLETS